MNDVPPPGQGPSDDDVDAFYRRASALDPSRPSAWVRPAILERAAQIAAKSAPAGELANDVKGNARRSQKRQLWWWRPAVFGTLAAAGLAGLLVLPHILRHAGSPPFKASASFARSQQLEPAATSPAAPPPPAVAPSPAGALPPADVPSPTVASSPIAMPSRAAEPPAVRQAKTLQRSERAAPPSAPATPSTLASRNAQADSAETIESISEPAPTLATPAPPSKAKPDGKSSARDLTVHVTPPPRYEYITIEGHRVEANDGAGAAVAAPTVAALASTNQPPDAHPFAPPEIAIGSPAALHQAAETGDLKGLQTSLDQLTDVNSRDDTGRTALLLATLHGQTSAVRFLLAKGADPNIADKNGVTPLRAATDKGQSAIATALKRAGAH